MHKISFLNAKAYGKITEQPNEKDVAEAEAMIQKILNSTPQQLGVEEEEARKRMKQK